MAKPAKDPAEENKQQASPEKQKALDTALAQIERQFGKGSVIKMSEKTSQLVAYRAEELLKFSVPNHPERQR